MTLSEGRAMPRCEGAAVLQRVNEEAAAELIAETIGHQSDEATVNFDEPPGFEPLDAPYEEDPHCFSAPESAVGCDLCGGVAKTTVRPVYGYRGGRPVEKSIRRVAMDRCILTNGCELAWGQQHPEFYDPDKHDPMNTPVKAPTPELLPCGGDRCSAVVRFLSPEGTFLGCEPQIENGTCGVDVAGRIWQEKGIDTLNRMQPDPIGDEVERFDGEVVTEGDIAAIEARAGITGDEAALEPPAPEQLE